MDSVVTDDVLYIGDREQAGQLAQALPDRSVRWVASSGAALALLDGDASGLGCLITDSSSVVREVEQQLDDAVCLTVDDGTFEDDGRLDHLAGKVTAAVDDSDTLPYPLPVDEEARRAGLEPYLRETVLDAGSFDRLASLACRLLEGNVGFVGLVDERLEHIIAASDEFPDSLNRGETVCTHTILNDGPFVVNDIAHDERFSDIGMLQELGIRAYAGVPVRGRYGEAIGVICVTDNIPRSFAPGDIELLENLAEEVTDQFELRRRLADDHGTVA